MVYARVRAGKESPIHKMYNGWAPSPGSAQSWHSWKGSAEVVGDHVPSLCPCKNTFLRLCFYVVLEKGLWYLVSQETSSLLGYCDNHMKVEVLRQRGVLWEGRDTAISQTAGKKKIVEFHLKISWEIQHTKCFAISTYVCLSSNWQRPWPRNSYTEPSVWSVPSARQREAE